MMTMLSISDRPTATMSLRRHSIISLMIVVGIVAFNLAIGRTIYESLPWRLAGLFLSGLIVQVGFCCLIWSRGRRRLYAFWAGVELGGLLGMTTFLYARVPESWLGSLWDQYANFIEGLLKVHFGLSVLDRQPDDPVLLATVGLFGFLPQFVMALGGGLLGLSLVWSSRSWVTVLKFIAGVGILLLNLLGWLAAWNTLPARPPWLLFGITPSGLVLELALFALIRNWAGLQSRAFWAGFIAVGSLVFWSYLWAMIFAPAQTAEYLTYWANGPWYAKPTSPAPVWKLWVDYTALASYILGQLPYGTYIVAWSDQSFDSMVYAMIVLLPHVLGGLAGGGLALFAVGPRSLHAHVPWENDLGRRDVTRQDKEW